MTNSQQSRNAQRRDHGFGSALAAGVLLAVAVFNFTDHKVADATVALGPIQLATRIIPIFGALGFSLYAAACSSGGVMRVVFNLVRKPPYNFWIWYCAIGAFSGWISHIQPMWSAWKLFEVFSVTVWAAALCEVVRGANSLEMLRRLFLMLFVVGQIVLIWALTNNVRDFGFSGGLSILLGGGSRLNVRWPQVNPLTLSMLAAFGITTVIAVLRGSILWRAVLVAPNTLVLVATRSRTGLLILAVSGCYGLLNRYVPVAAKVKLFMLILVAGGILAFSEEARTVMRVSSVSEVAMAGGRVQAELRGQSAWQDAADLIMARPFIGHGYINVARFLEDRIVPDNGVLQSLVTAGLIGAIPMILFIFALPLLWLRTLLIGSLTSETVLLSTIGTIAAAVSLVKCMATNELSNHGFALMLIFISAIALSECQRRRGSEFRSSKARLKGDIRSREAIAKP